MCASRVALLALPALTIRTRAQVFGGSLVRTVACGFFHTIAVTSAGEVYTFGQGSAGQLGHQDKASRVVPTRISPVCFDHAKIAFVAAGEAHSAAVTEEGTVYTFGTSSSLGHGDGHGVDSKLYCEVTDVPRPVALVTVDFPLGSRVGAFHGLLPAHAMAFAMGTHVRLGRRAPIAAAGTRKKSLRLLGKPPEAAGEDCAYVTMPAELVRRLVLTCGIWQERRATEYAGVMRLCGGNATE